MHRRRFLATGVASVWAAAGVSRADENDKRPLAGRVRVAVVQFDALAEQVERNLSEMARLSKQAAAQGAKWILFHEGTVCDYTPRLAELAEPVPEGRSTCFMAALAAELKVSIAFGLSERESDRYYITQVFVTPAGFLYRYRKTWLWRSPEDQGYRDEWTRYDPGTGPDLFEIDGLRVACFICADGKSPRCIARLKQMRPQVVFFPNNRKTFGSPDEYAELAKQIAAPMLVANRVGKSWMHECDGGSIIHDGDGTVLARANHVSQEQILVHDLIVPQR